MSSSEEEYEDVRSYFSEVEWSGLVKWERKRYRNMKRNHLAMLAIGLKATAPEFMRGGQTKMADPPQLPGLSDSEEEEEWTPALERPPPRPRSFSPPARRRARVQKAAPPRSTPANPAAQPPSSEGAGPSGSRRPPSSEGAGPSGSRRPPSSEGAGPSRSRRPPSSEGAGPSGSRRPPSSEGAGPSGSRRPPSSEGAGPSGSRRPPSSEGAGPSRSSGSRGRQRSKVNLYCRGRNLRDRVRVNYTESEEPKDDDYLYCEQCNSLFLEECEVHGPLLFIPDTPVVLGETDRARLTLPRGLEVRRSQIPGAGLGVFNCGEAVAKGTHYGPYEGEVMEKEVAEESGYSWLIRKSRKWDEYIDAQRETHSNWMRYVNCARTEDEQNIIAFQYRGGVLYRCSRGLAVGEELLVWYGEEYARELGISFDRLWKSKSTARGVASESSQTEVFSCSECPVSYTSQIYLYKHIKRNHDNLYVSLLRSGEVRPETLYSSSSSSRSLPITTSNTPLTPSPAWRQRDTDKPRPFHCDECGKNFSHGPHLRRHQLVHTGEKPFHCDQCGKNFSRGDELRKHQRVHTGEKPFHCDLCGKNFSRGDELRKHQRVHTGEKPFHCDQCGKNFSRGDELRKHQRVHTGEKPFHCDQCGKNFSQEGHLRTHQCVHTGEKPFHCDQCGKNFSEASNLRRHQRVQHGGPESSGVEA